MAITFLTAVTGPTTIVTVFTFYSKKCFTPCQTHPHSLLNIQKHLQKLCHRVMVLLININNTKINRVAVLQVENLIVVVLKMRTSESFLMYTCKLFEWIFLTYSSFQSLFRKVTNTCLVEFTLKWHFSVFYTYHGWSQHSYLLCRIHEIPQSLRTERGGIV